MKFAPKAIVKEGTSGKFWKEVLLTGAGVVGGEIATSLAGKLNLGETISELAGGVLVGGIGLATGNPAVAAGTVATKSLKLINRSV
jgi:hypothetical protein